ILEEEVQDNEAITLSEEEIALDEAASDASHSSRVIVSLFTAGAYLSFLNIAPQQARAKARSDYVKSRLKKLLQED
ncbi:hypothetical protein Tco_1431412, partial [Tanacetum coccineum]